MTPPPARPKVVHGDCLDIMRMLPDNSVDSICTDPPYGLSATTPEGIAETMTKWATGEREYIPAGKGFMGKSWDAFVPPPALWDEAMRVLKPGGHLLAFAGSRTQDLMGLSIRLAGFDIRDSLAWIAGSGFPKSHNITKALGDKACQCREGDPRDVTDPATKHDLRSVPERDVPAPERTGSGEGPVLLAGVQEQGASTTGRPELPNDAEWSGQPGMEGWGHVQAEQGELHRAEVCPLPARVADDGAEGRLHHGTPPSDGSVGGSSAAEDGSGESHQPRHAGQPAGEPGTVPIERGSQAGGSWPICAGCGKQVIPDGLGTALKPAIEPIILARKPFKGTVAANVQQWGTGALNIDATRIGWQDESERDLIQKRSGQRTSSGGWGFTPEVEDREKTNPAGRWPANVVLDEHAAEVLEESRFFKVAESDEHGAISQHFPREFDAPFMYVAKAPKKERPVVDGVAHATVKPLALMRWLVKLVTPPGGTVLEPFAGSGTTVEACILEGFHCIAIEREAEYLPLIQARIDRQAA